MGDGGPFKLALHNLPSLSLLRLFPLEELITIGRNSAVDQTVIEGEK